MKKKRTFKPHDHDYGECARGAEHVIADGHTIFQKWWCAGCGHRCLASRANHWTPLCVCEDCGTITDVKQQGCNYAAVLTVRRGRR